MRFLNFNNSTLCRKAQPISERFEAGICDSSASANRLPCRMELPLSYVSRSEKKPYLRISKLTPFLNDTAHIWTFRSDSCEVENRPPCRTAKPILDRFAEWKRYSWASANRPLTGRHYPYLNVSQAEYAIPEHQHTTRMLDGPAHILCLAVWKKPFLNFSKSTVLQDGTVHIWTFRSLKTLFLTINKSTPFAGRNSPYGAWKRGSWTSANRPPSRMALLIYERFLAWKRFSLASKIDLFAERHCQFLNLSQPENVISEDHQIDPLAGWRCSYMKVFQPEYAIPENQKIDIIAVRHSTYLNVSRPEKALPNHQQIDPLCRTEQPISHRFAVWKYDSWTSTIRPLAARHCPFLNVSKPEYAISKHLHIDTLEGRRYSYMYVPQPENANI